MFAFGCGWYSADVTSPKPLVFADNVRIDFEGSPAVEEFTVETTGANVIVIGAPQSLFDACAGTREVTSGTLRIGGADPREAVCDAGVASAPIDPLLPPRWTIRDLARESARLAGHTRREALARAEGALRALKLDKLAQTRLGACELPVRRAAVLAAAIATGAETLLVADFTRGLPDDAARALARLFVAAAETLRWVLFAGQVSLSSPLGLHADEALVFVGGRLSCAGPPAEIATRDRTYALRTAGEGAPAFAARLRELGVRVESDEAARSLTVTLPAEVSTLDLVTMAQAGKVVVLELLPVSRGLV